jgi:hypothetical protein
MCLDVRRLILSKLNVRELARVAPTCQEFRQACVAQMAMHRADIIAAGRQTLGDNMFSNLVSALQWAMCNLDPCPGLVTTFGHVGILTADREPVITTEADAIQRGLNKGVCVYLEKRTCYRLLSAEVRLGGNWDGIAIDVRRFPDSPHMELSVQILRKENAVAGLGILLAVCAENPKAMLPCLQNPITIHLTFLGFPDPVKGWEILSVLVGSLGSLANRYSLMPFLKGQNPTPCKGKPGMGHDGVVSDVTVVYCDNWGSLGAGRCGL